MKILFFFFIFHLCVTQGKAQTNWVTKRIESQLQVQFPTEPQEADYGINHNWLVFADSTLFQFSKIKQAEKGKSNYQSCRQMISGVVDQSKGKLLQTDSAKVKGYCVVYFTVQPTAAPLEKALLKGLVLDMDGKSYLLMATTERKDLSAVNRFINSFKILGQ